ncbi:hypothetical protein [Arenicella chitinivorans]|uniref:hypothetical protein n=1 Tax=Arenicella chitinivorans TaxID=1329800 RepID=UPI001673C771|nr:hypothetical protein [Arenicella chitinivorans]
MKSRKNWLLMVLLCVGGCSVSGEQALYNNCVDLGTEEQMEGWDESDRPSVKAGVKQGCEMIMKECEKDPDGAMCVAFKEKYGAE